MQNLLKDPERKQVIDYCHSRYGVAPEQWQNFDLLLKKEGLWLRATRGEATALSSFIEEHAEVEGLRILSGKSFPYKVTHHFYQVFSSFINKGVLPIDQEQALALLKRETLAWDEIPKGYYFCLFQDRFMGIALKTDQGLVSQVPKSLTGQLAKNLDLSF